MVQRRYLTLVCTAGCLLLFAPALLAQTLQVTSADGKTAALTAAQIANARHVSVTVRDHDTPAQFEGVPLSMLLSLAGIQVSGLRGPRLSQALVVEAADGYMVVFALAEIDPDFATREIILADKRDGKPLDLKEGPLRIVAPGDKRAARWVRQVTALRIVAVN